MFRLRLKDFFWLWWLLTVSFNNAFHIISLDIMYILAIITSVFALDSNVLGDLSVSETLTCSSLSSTSVYSTGVVTTSSSLTTSDLTTTDLKVSELTISTIYPQDSTIIIDSDLVIYPPSTSASFFQVSWQILSHNNFKSSKEGWSGDLSSCNSNNFISSSSDLAISKVMEIPSSNQIRLTANIHFIDNWSGESVQLRVNNQLMWSSQATSGEINICGGPHADAGYAVPVDITLPYTNPLKIEFSSQIPKEKGYFGVDNIIIYLK